jgi:hypothetical protein
MNDYEYKVTAVSKPAKSKHSVAFNRLTESKPKSGHIIVGLPQGAQCSMEVIKEHKAVLGEYSSNSQHQASVNRSMTLNSNYNSNPQNFLKKPDSGFLNTHQSTAGYDSSATDKYLKYIPSNAELLERVYETINYINGEDLGCLLNDL